MKTIYEQLIKELPDKLSFCESITHERITDDDGPEYIFHLTMYNSNNNLMEMRLRLAFFEEEIAITTYVGDSYEASKAIFVNSVEKGMTIVQYLLFCCFGRNLYRN